MTNKALIVIDMQNELKNMYNFDSTLNNINNRIDLFHREKLPVIFMQHIDNDMPINSFQWNLINTINHENKDIYFNKYQPDSFFNTGLENFLKINNIKNIELCGAQTEFCVDTTIKVGFHLGFNLTINYGCFSTMDTNELTAKQINDFYWNIWNKKFVNISR